jgi:hypothetical protein
LEKIGIVPSIFKNPPHFSEFPGYSPGESNLLFLYVLTCEGRLAGPPVPAGHPESGSDSDFGGGARTPIFLVKIRLSKRRLWLTETPSGAPRPKPVPADARDGAPISDPAESEGLGFLGPFAHFARARRFI